jgi:hypothetical protein
VVRFLIALFLCFSFFRSFVDALFVSLSTQATVVHEISRPPKDNQKATFDSFNNGGVLSLAAAKTFTLTNFTNAPASQMFVSGTANVAGFTAQGLVSVAPSGTIANVGATGFLFGVNNNTIVSSGGLIDLGVADAMLIYSVMTNNGIRSVVWLRREIMECWRLRPEQSSWPCFV